MFNICLQNRITYNKGDYKCYLCHHIMKQCNFDKVEEHLLTDKHQEKLNQINKKQREKETEKLFAFSEKQRRKIVENLVTFDRNSLLLNCRVCQCKISGLSNTLAHIDGSLHKQKWNNFIKRDSIGTEKVLSNESIKVKSTVNKSINDQPSIADLQSESNFITFDEKTNSYYCNICKTKIIATPNVNQHTHGLLHQDLESKLKSSPSTLKLKSDFIIYDKKCNSYHCKICKCKIISTPNITEHIHEFRFLHQVMLDAQKASEKKEVDKISKDSLHQTMLETQKVLQTQIVNSSTQKTILQNHDLKSDFTFTYSCKPCNVSLKDNIVTQYHVMLHLFKEFEILNNFDLLKFKLTTNGLFNLNCLLCKFSCVSSMLEAHTILDKHYKTEIHLKRLKLFKYNKTVSGLDIEEDIEEQINSLDLKTVTYNIADSISSQFLCNVCNVHVPFSNINIDEHVSGKLHMKNLENKGNETVVVTKNGFYIKDLNYYKCFICNQLFSHTSTLLYHYKTVEHEWKVKSLKMIEKCPYTNFQTTNKTEIIRCSLCSIYLYDIKSTVDHISGKKHIENLKLSSSNLENQKSVSTTPLVQVVNELKHLNINSKNVTKNEEKCVSFVQNQNVSVIKTKCLRKIKNASSFETSIKELNQLGFNADNIQPLSTLRPDVVDNVLDNLVPLEFKNSQIKKLPSLAKPKLPRIPKIDKEKNSFAKNVLLNGKSYIKYCIDPGEHNIYHFNNDKIKLMQLGVSLTFPYNSTRVCVVCGHQFKDDIQSLFEHLQNQEHLQNIYDMQVDNEEFKEYPEQFSHLRLAKLFMQTESDQSIKCHACNLVIDDKDEIIKQHAKGSSHVKKSRLWKEQSDKLFNQYLTIYKDIWYYAEVFFCEICKKKCEFEIDFAMHLLNSEHIKKVYEQKVKGIDSKYDLCPSCITYWFGKTDSYDTHCKSQFHKRFVKNKDFMVPDLTITASDFLNDIDKNINLLINESDKIILEKHKETELLKAVVETVKPIYSNSKAYIFGSRLSHLGFPNSDVDVFLDCENVYYIGTTQEQSQQYIKSIKSYFESAPNTWIVDEVLLATRVPIMKLRHISTNLKCDISFINGLSVEKSQLVGLYNIAFPICRQLIIFMKKWLILCRIFGSDYITTFAISWCVIFYLQLQGILPTVHDLIKSKNESKIVDGWECGFLETITVKSSHLCFEEHLKGFFTYFANFDYQKSVICPYLGKPINKRSFAYTEELSTKMNIYKKRLENNEVEIFQFDSPMCIQDPLDLSQNMTKAVKKQQLRCFRQYCNLSAKKC